MQYSAFDLSILNIIEFDHLISLFDPFTPPGPRISDGHFLVQVVKFKSWYSKLITEKRVNYWEHFGISISLGN